MDFDDTMWCDSMYLKISQIPSVNTVLENAQVVTSIQCYTIDKYRTWMASNHFSLGVNMVFLLSHVSQADYTNVSHLTRRL